MPGWPLAVSALKPSGGVLHVHENVCSADVELWVQRCCERFEQLFEAKERDCAGQREGEAEAGEAEEVAEAEAEEGEGEGEKVLRGRFHRNDLPDEDNRRRKIRVSCFHLEKVKSYAPRVYHVVADLLCAHSYV